jgi:F0F1-type ATP synthase delta subunit
MNADSFEVTVAKKYAHAFLNVSAKKVVYEDVKHIESIGYYLETHALLSLYFKLSVSDETHKEAVMTRLKLFGFPEYMYALIELLIKSQRLFLLSEICRWIGVYFRQQQHISEFLVTSPRELSLEHKEKIDQFLATYTHGTVETVYALDQALIAGLRMQSKTHVWEKSIAQQLRDVQLKSMR